MLTEEELNQGLNTCDICNTKVLSGELIWFDESFEPKENEIVKWPYIELNDIQASCHQCYFNLCLEDKETK